MIMKKKHEHKKKTKEKNVFEVWHWFYSCYEIKCLHVIDEDMNR